MSAAHWRERWTALPQRQKLLLGGGTLALLLALGDAALTAPMERRLQRAESEIQALREQVQTLQTAAQQAAPLAAQARSEEARLRERLQSAQRDSAALRLRVAEAARLPETLRAVTATVGSARLLALDLAGDADAPRAAAGGPTAASAVPRAQRLYRLPITLKVSGSYDELQLLLSQIEQHAQALQWSSIALDSAAWPAIELTLKAHVLSLEPRWGALP